jgi:hypothetical protein
MEGPLAKLNLCGDRMSIASFPAAGSHLTAPAGPLVVPALPGGACALSRLFRRLYLRELENAFAAGKMRFFSNLASLVEP